MATDYISQYGGDTVASERFSALKTNSSLFLGRGSTTQPFSNGEAGKNFIGNWFATTATAAGSDTRGDYLRLYFNGATTGGGDVRRTFGTINAAVGTVHGMHTSLSFGASGSVSEQAIVSRNTLQLKAGTATGTLAPVQSEFWLDAATSAPSTAHSFFRAVVGGDATNKATIKNLFSIEGAKATAASSGVADIVTTGAADSPSTTKIRILIDGTPYWLLATATPPSAL